MAFWKRLGLLAVALIEGFPAAALAKAINVALRQYGAQPCFQRTPPVKIAEERTFTALAIHQAVEFREQRIGEFLSIGTRAAAFRYGTSGRPQGRTIFAHKIFPGRFGTFEAGRSKGQVPKVEGLQILDQVISGRRNIREAFAQAALEGRCKLCQGEAPLLGTRFEVQGIQDRCGNPAEVRRIAVFGVRAAMGTMGTELLYCI